MKQLKRVLYLLPLLLILVFFIPIQTVFAQSCNITIKTAKANNININSGVGYFELHVTFAQAMNTGTITVSFSENIDFAFTTDESIPPVPTITWADDKSCVIRYSVVNFSKTAYDVYAEVNAKATGGQNFSCQSEKFQVDKGRPSCNIVCSPPTITPATSNFVVTVKYSEEMNHDKAPDISFDPSNVGETLGTPTTAWSGNDYVLTYPVNSSSQQNIATVLVTAKNGLDKADNLQNDQTVGFGIQMARNVGTVSFLSSPDGGTHVNQLSNTFAVKVTYASKMRESIIPAISFTPDVSSTLTNTPGGWSDNSTVYTYNYTVNTSSTQNATVEATIAGAIDDAGKALESSKGSFRIDLVSPKCQIAAPDVSKGTTTYTVVLTYDEEMSTAAPIITIEPSDANAIFGALNGSWDITGKIYTANFPVTRTPPGLFTTANIKVSGAKDVAGNVQEEANQSFAIDQRDVDVTVSMNPAIIQSSSTSALLTLHFNVNMDQASAPAIVFDPVVQGAIVPKANGAKWVDAKTYTIEYDLDKTKKVEIKDIDVTVSAAKNTDGETMASKKVADVFTINFLAPSCTVTFEPEVVLDGATTLTVALKYDTDMDMTSVPNITFGNFLSYDQTFTNERYSWSDNRTCVFIYDIVDKNAQNPYILLTAGDAKSATGNVQVDCDATKLLIVDMLDFVVNVSAIPSTVNCNSSQLVVSVEFNQPMNETSSNIVTFPNFDPKGFITPTKTEWTTVGSTYVFQAEYAVHANVFADNPSIDIQIAPVNNFLGREYTGATFPGKFAAKSTPPSIDNATAQSPQCYGVENGEIHLTVSGGTSPLTYTWTKDDEPFTATGTDATSLGAGTYDVVVTGSDNCYAAYSVTLTNPESVTLEAEVKHNLEKVSDGEIVLTTSGGTVPYTYFMNGTPQGDKTDYTGLDAGVYNFEVRDANTCAAIASAEIKNYQTPTIFTPNGDGFNDTFMKGNTVQIFDRNGTLVYKGNDGWDGRYKGQLVRPAVYFYIVTFDDGYQKKGTIQVYKQ